MSFKHRPSIAVFKFASCDGCQLSLLELEDELVALAGALEIAYFPEASSNQRKGPYNIGLVEGSITTAHDAARILEIRRACRFLIAIGVCATHGGVQALRNDADIAAWTSAVYSFPLFIGKPEKSTPISAHVTVDYELQGCPVNKRQLLEVLSAMLAGREPDIPRYSVCVECKRRGNVCITVAQGAACQGPQTRAGCGAICPAFGRGCYGCFGPLPEPNPKASPAVKR